MPRFAGISLRSRWGLSSDVELPSPQFCRDMAGEGMAVLFTPTIAVRDPLSGSAGRAFTRFHLISSGELGIAALTRPLSSSIEEVAELLSAVGGEVKKVLSIAAGALGEALDLLEKFRGEVDAVELDVELSRMLAGKAGKGLTYVTELAKELHSVLETPLILKLTAMSAGLIDLHALADEAGASALTLTPNVVYRVGDHYFRLHSPLVSSAALLNAIEPLSEVGVDVAYVVRGDEGRWGEAADIFPLKLFDVTLMLKWLGFEGRRKEGRIPLRWRSVDRRLKIVASEGARYCPYRLISGEGVVESCNYCGVCLELNPPGVVRLAAILRPE